MKTSIAALPFLILTAQAAIDMMSNLKFDLSRPNRNHHSMSQGGFHRPTDCCMSYTPRNIRCVFMENYIDTSSACSRPAVIFLTKKGQRVCADPNNEGVQKCKSELRLGSAVGGPEMALA
uniref:Chemokine interleukin-8-like domain-containing protein n=1 Tax=Moschus moschiferus TaxID=68415 RepID=A0A8C6DSY5_MOSMO